jgi:hypothetical protein
MSVNKWFSRVQLSSGPFFFTLSCSDTHKSPEMTGTTSTVRPEKNH